MAGGTGRGGTDRGGIDLGGTGHGVGWRCRLLGHRFRFRADGATMRWACVRGCPAGGEKRYPSAADARRYAATFDREDGADLGRRAPLGLFPLRLARFLRRRRAGGAERRS